VWKRKEEERRHNSSMLWYVKEYTSEFLFSKLPMNFNFFLNI